MRTNFSRAFAVLAAGFGLITVLFGCSTEDHVDSRSHVSTQQGDGVDSEVPSFAATGSLGNSINGSYEIRNATLRTIKLTPGVLSHFQSVTVEVHDGSFTTSSGAAIELKIDSFGSFLNCNA